VALDLAGLPAGRYTVTANSANSFGTAFDLPEFGSGSTTATIPTEAPAATPADVPPSAPAESAIGGLVWIEGCPQSAAATGADDCADRANGNFDEGDTPLAGALLRLSPGQCPGSDLIFTTVTTAEDGSYEFTALQAGPHCIVIDPQAEQNQALFPPGGWTVPEQGRVTVTVRPEERVETDFGWAAQMAPAAESTPTAAPALSGPDGCREQAAYVGDVTIPDNTLVPPGETFVKTWQIRNDGDCTWGPGYALVFDGEAQLSGPDLVPLTEHVGPGETVELSVTLVAPERPGTYRSEWKIRDPAGARFGSRGDFAFYLLIEVQ
jgi:hypothetical protein